jgi:DNA-binding response OmpR family regulator
LQILIVDDDPGTTSSVAELVRMLGHEAHIANSGARALEIAQATPIDVALLDIEMPGMDGHEVARRLVLLRRQAVYIVAVTGRGSEADMVRSATAGFIEHVVKPCSRRHLANILARAADHLKRRRPPAVQAEPVSRSDASTRPGGEPPR